MARPNLELIRALRAAAARLSEGSSYRWSDFASCNCGHLVQSVTQLSPREIYEAAFLRGGDWGEQAREFCASSGYPIDFMLARLFELGLDAEDVRNLERLSDDRVLRELGVRELRYTRREDVVCYLRAWARSLERQLGPALFCSRADPHASAAEPEAFCEAAE
jgi:hypothetical protein